MTGFIKRVTEDLFNLEVNTIVSAQITGEKPQSKRKMLYQLAGNYHNKLMSLKKPNGEDFRQPVYWEFGGLCSFRELRDRASDGCEELRQTLKETHDSQAMRHLMRDMKMLERIRNQSKQIVHIFRDLDARSMKQRDKNEDGYAAAGPIKPEEDAAGPFPSHNESRFWNNDLSLADMNAVKVADLPMEAVEVMHIGKAWELGTSDILFQTKISLSGDVTNRISEVYLAGMDTALLEIHQKAVNTSISFWTGLLKAVAEFAAGAVGKLLGNDSGKSD